MPVNVAYSVTQGFPQVTEVSSSAFFFFTSLSPAVNLAAAGQKARAIVLA